MKKGLTRLVFLLALAASAAFAVCDTPANRATQPIAKDAAAKDHLDKTNNAMDKLGKGSPDSAKDNLGKNGADTKDDLAKEGGDAKDNLSKGGPCAKDNLGVRLL